jgi:hypothetical protein
MALDLGTWTMRLEQLGDRQTKLGFRGLRNDGIHS